MLSLWNATIHLQNKRLLCKFEQTISTLWRRYRRSRFASPSWFDIRRPHDAPTYRSKQSPSPITATTSDHHRFTESSRPIVANLRHQQDLTNSHRRGVDRQEGQRRICESQPPLPLEFPSDCWLNCMWCILLCCQFLVVSCSQFLCFRTLWSSIYWPKSIPVFYHYMHGFRFLRFLFFLFVFLWWIFSLFLT